MRSVGIVNPCRRRFFRHSALAARCLKSGSSGRSFILGSEWLPVNFLVPGADMNRSRPSYFDYQTVRFSLLVFDSRVTLLVSTSHNETSARYFNKPENKFLENLVFLPFSTLDTLPHTFYIKIQSQRAHRDH